MIGWVKRRFGLDSGSDFSSYTLYEIGNTMCRHHPDGIRNNGWPSSSNKATHFGEYSMKTVLRDAYSDVGEITPSMIHDIDRLLNESEPSFIAKQSGSIAEDKVHKFRRLFFDQFTDETIRDALQRLYFDTREDFALDTIVGEETTDAHSYRFQIAEPQRAQLVREDEQMPIETTQFHEKSVTMQKVAARLNLAESPITSTIEELVVVEAEMLWDKIEVTNESESLGSVDEISMSMIEAIDAIRVELGNPDTIVANGDVYNVGNAVYGNKITADKTEVMDVPFIVADSDRLGYRVTQQPLSVDRLKDGIEPYVYRMQWNGNYVITDEDVVIGPR